MVCLCQGFSMCTICKVKLKSCWGQRPGTNLGGEPSISSQVHQAMSRQASNDHQIYNHQYTLLPENIYLVQVDHSTRIIYLLSINCLST